MKMNGFNVVVSKDYHTWTGHRRDRGMYHEAMRLGWLCGTVLGFVFGVWATCGLVGFGLLQ